MTDNLWHCFSAFKHLLCNTTITYSSLFNFSLVHTQWSDTVYTLDLFWFLKIKISFTCLDNFIWSVETWTNPQNTLVIGEQRAYNRSVARIPACCIKLTRPYPWHGSKNTLQVNSPKWKQNGKSELPYESTVTKVMKLMSKVNWKNNNYHTGW